MLIAMAVHCTSANGRTPYLERTLKSLARRVSFARHRLYLCDNASEEAAYALCERFSATHDNVIHKHFSRNLGTAAAINRAWYDAEPGETVCKMDDDVVVACDDWPDLLEDAFSRKDVLGICGLKRKDLAECPWSPVDFYRSKVEMLPHEPGQRWLVVEHVVHVFGTVQAYSPACRQALGFLYQMQDMGNRYGYDDALASVRARKAGFETAFLLGPEIDHIDPGNTAFAQEKQDNAGKWQPVFEQVKREYIAGQRPIYWEDK